MVRYLSIVLLVCSLAYSNEPFNAKVIGVSGNGTITVQKDDEKMEIRIYGIDVPEADQPFGTQSTSMIEFLVSGKEVTVTPINKDKNGRTAAMISYMNLDIGLMLISTGNAWVNNDFCKVKHCELLRDYEAAAKKHKYGLWENDNAVAPWEWRTLTKEDKLKHSIQVNKQGTQSTQKQVSVEDTENKAPTIQRIEGRYWQSASSGMIHNDKCRYYATSKGEYVAEDAAGENCSRCGGKK